MEERRVELEGYREVAGADDAPTASAEGTPIYVALNGEFLGTISVADPIREDARAAVAALHADVGIAVATVAALLTGVMFGEVHMAGGMLIHEASVMVVILNGMRLLR